MFLSIFTLFATFPAIFCYAQHSYSSGASFHWVNGSDNQHTSDLRAGAAIATSSAPVAHCSSPIAVSSTGTKRRHVVVGAGAALRFSPNKMDANVGDVIQFRFLALNHTLTQSSLSHPCTPAGGFNTGFRQFNPTNNSGQFIVEYHVNTLSPEWFFCAQTKSRPHCEAGMVFALNPGNKFSPFLAAAIASPSSLATAPEDPEEVAATVTPYANWSVDSLTASATIRPIQSSATRAFCSQNTSASCPTPGISVVPVSFSQGAKCHNGGTLFSMVLLFGTIFSFIRF